MLPSFLNVRNDERKSSSDAYWNRVCLIKLADLLYTLLIKQEAIRNLGESLDELKLIVEKVIWKRRQRTHWKILYCSICFSAQLYGQRTIAKRLNWQIKKPVRWENTLQLKEFHLGEQRIILIWIFWNVALEGLIYRITGCLRNLLALR